LIFSQGRDKFSLPFKAKPRDGQSIIFPACGLEVCDGANAGKFKQSFDLFRA
jgi:hypothetical protein